MAAVAQETTRLFSERALPRISFVLGKGGVGRSTVAAALGLALAEGGKRVLVLQWALRDAIGPWFGHPPVAFDPIEVSPRLWLANFTLEGALRAYFLDHLHAGFLYRRVIHARAVAQLLEVAPGLAEIFFLGELWWLTTLAEREAGLRFDRIIVDAPATGHGASLLDVPGTLSKMPAAGLLAIETRRVVAMMSDPTRTGAVVVSQPEPLVVHETLELIPRLTALLRRPPIGVVINRSTSHLEMDERLRMHDAVAGRLSPTSQHALDSMLAELHASNLAERGLRQQLHGPTLSLPDLPGQAPRNVVRQAAASLRAAA